MHTPEFIHLHVHTEYSLLDGAASVKKLVAKAVERGAPAVAITDHGNMYAAIQFYDECVAKKIKPIIGCEFYVTDDLKRKGGRNTEEENKLNHLVLIAKSPKGFRNLAKLNSIAWIDGFYYKPRIDLETLKQYTEDVICLSACLAGKIPQLLLKNDYEGAKQYALTLKSMFAEGDFYIELQDHGLEEQKRTNPLLVKIAREIGVKCVATNDVHYINRSDAEMHDVLLCIQTASYYDDPKDKRMSFPNDEFYLKTYDEMEQILGWCPESLQTPYEIADKCNISFIYNQYQLPRFACPDNLTPAEYLRKITYEGLERRYGTITDEIRERAESELEVIISMGFPEYYLIVWDFIFYARSQDIPLGYGRGSGVGSIVAYAIGITNVDPLKYDLIFERFLNKNRTSMPDFDIDFCYNRRGEVIQYVKNKYGADHISQIITFGKLKKKAAIKDVARVFRIPFSDVSTMTKNIGDFGGDDKKVHILDLVNPESKYCVPELLELYRNRPEYKKVIDIASQIEGMPRNTSVHAAGVVIYKNPAADTIPLAKNGDEITTQFNMTEVEKLGLLKMDFLALMTLTDIKMAHDYVLERTGRDIDFEKLGYDDAAVYELIGSGNTDAVFQLEGGGMKKFMARFRPRNMEDIIAGISLYRPGPMDNIDTFLQNRAEPDKIRYKHPLLEPILRVTNGIIVYQEQAMMITRKLAGYDMTRADSFRAIISKKKVDKIPIERQVFRDGLLDQDGNVVIAGCVRNGIAAEVADSIFAEMESFASYAFNKSHAAAYAVLSYITAFYKRYYPVEFLAAVINNRIDKPDDTEKYMRVLKDMEIALLPPDINRSEALFSPEGTAIRYGLACIKNVGKAAMDVIISERAKNGPYRDLYDFVERNANSSVNKRMIESLIRGGAFDCFGHTRATLMGNYEAVIATVDQNRKRALSGQFDLFSMLEDEPETFRYQTIKEFSNLDKLLQEKEMLGMYVSGHPLAGYEKDFAGFNFNTSMLPKPRKDEEGEEEFESADTEEPQAKDNMDVTTGGLLTAVNIKRTKDGKEMAVCLLEDLYGRIEILLFSRALAGSKQYLVKDSVVRVRGKLSLRDDEAKITCNDVRPWELSSADLPEAPPEPEDTRTLYLNIRPENLDKLDRIDKILRAHPGSGAVKLQIDGKIYLHNATIRDPDLVARELAGIVGGHNVKVF